MGYFKFVADSMFELIHIYEDILHLSFRSFTISFSLLLPLIFLLIFLIIITFILIKLVLIFVPSGSPEKLNIAFFHPYCNAGGGGERVLWTAIKAIQQRYSQADCYVYTGDTDSSPEQIIENCRRRFNITFEREPRFIYLNLRTIIDAKYHPFCTLLMQSLASLILGAEALAKFRPQIFVDSMGYAFTYPLFRFIGGCPVASYTHYPTISSEMLQKVSDRTEAYNNRSIISQCILLSFMKLIYYNIFAILYGLVGSCAHVVMVNSTWTKSHISSLWKFGANVEIVFPPCNSEKFTSFPLVDDNDKNFKTIVSIGQFRPEKDYPFQLRIFKAVLQSLESEIANKMRLILIGGVRNSDDQMRVDSLKALAAELEIQDKVIWKINAPFTELLQEVQNGTLGIHTMWNEHFGIGIVESMAGGLIVVAHDSGGPKMDIITPYHDQPTGYLASTEESYVEKINHVLNLSNKEKMDIRENARSSTSRFSDELFQEKFLSSLQPLLNPNRSQ